VNWIAGAPPSGPIRVRVQVRHRHKPALARVEALGQSGAAIEFEEPVRAVAPGQAAVFYDADRDEEVMGGGWLVEGRP
jgi:tRNA-specific 2-thiouridylase